MSTRPAGVVAVSSVWPFLIGAFVLFFGGAASAVCTKKASLDELIQIQKAEKAVISVCTKQIIRNELPATLFGFNVMHYYFEREIFDVATAKVPDLVLTQMRELPGALYRYPGGLVSNRFSWEASVGPLSQREPLKSVKWAEADKLRFGLDEYLGFVSQVNGQPWYVLNLVGWEDVEMFTELDPDYIASSNGRLARYMRDRLDPDTTRYFQLGNELDRADYQWSHDKYIQRARLSIDQMRIQDPDARFVAFLREFDWVYKGSEKTRGVSRYQNFIRDVLEDLPEVNDFSLHFYYDARNTTENYRRLPWRLRQFRRAMDAARQARNGRMPQVWITEHARGIDFGNVKAAAARPFTSNLSAAISTGDFLIALAQMPEVQGAVWHGFNATPWQLFDPNPELAPTPVYWGMRVLRQQKLPQVYATRTRSPNRSGYLGGYDLRAAAFGDQSNNRLGLWVSNRSAVELPVDLHVPEWAGRPVRYSLASLSGTAGANPDRSDAETYVNLEPEFQTGRFSKAGVLKIKVLPASVSNLTINTLD